ncbi:MULTISPECIES: P-loop NTPase fold protein [Oscillospiraceae]|uniref:KAP family P-loop NTPase fold protein n=1 Tax=Oscillospiraceae TaxID=216572 RepID=UPI001105B68C|nr:MULTISPECIES: P-loop NTPase fold protein [Oscillospiraceae]
MKKYVQEATDINVWTSLKDNTFDRGKDIREFIEGLELIEGNAFISLDAKWGDGKTFFVRQIEETLKYFWAKKMETEEKPLKDLNSYEYLKESVAVKQTTVEHIYLPVYYNAWMYDDHNDPLMSLLLVMTKQCGGAYNTKINTKSLGERLLAVASSLPISIKKVNPATLIKDLQEGKMDILSAVKTEEDIKECVRDVFNDIIVEEAEKLVIFIDELDRCKPSFAIEMLERIKHYFDDERIIFVVSLNKEQLIHTISNYYGSEFDSTRYLNHFFDVSINLPEISRSQRQKVQCTDSERFWITLIADALSDYYGFSLRDKLIYKSSIESITREVGDAFSSDKMYLIIFEVIVVLLDMVDAKEKKAFLEGKSNILIDLMPRIEIYKKYIVRSFGIDIGDGYEEKLTEKYKLVQAVYEYVFGRVTEEYFKEADISRNLKEICIRACNGLKSQNRKK